MPKKVQKKTTRLSLDVDELIVEVQKHPSLYDTENVSYRDTEKSVNIWGTVGAMFEISGAECKLKWKTLRDAYVKKKKMLKTTSGQAATRVKKWKHLQSMSFLDTYIQERNTTSNMAADEFEDEDIDYTSDEKNDNDDVESDADIVLGASDPKTPINNGRASGDIPSPSASGNSTPLPIQKPAKQRKVREGKLDPVGQLMVDYIEEKKRKSEAREERHARPPPDEDELFLSSLVPTLRRLPPQQKALTKLKIHEILFDAENNIYEAQNLPNIQHRMQCQNQTQQQSKQTIIQPQMYIHPQPQAQAYPHNQSELHTQFNTQPQLQGQTQPRTGHQSGVNYSVGNTVESWSGSQTETLTWV